MTYHVFRDTSEHEGHGWWFDESPVCSGTTKKNLFTGDYSIDGFYDSKIFVIERKGKVAEFVGNITIAEKWADFKDELQRLEEFKHPFVICEFPFSLLEKYPVDSGVPKRLWKHIRVQPQFLVKRFMEINLRFKTKFIFADAGGKALASSLFKRMVEMYPDVRANDPPAVQPAAD